MFNNLPQVHLKLLQKKQIHETAEVPSDLISKSQKIHCRVVQIQLKVKQTSLKKDIYFEKKDYWWFMINKIIRN